eukprot:6485186-Lingulodinium_polyedra.AAC.1
MQCARQRPPRSPRLLRARPRPVSVPPVAAHLGPDMDLVAEGPWSPPAQPLQPLQPLQSAP